MLHFSVLSSGSKANCIYVGSESTHLLFDCGLSGRQTEKRLQLIGKEIRDLDGVVVSHEHSDHVRGINRLVEQFDVPVFLSDETRYASPELSGLRRDHYRPVIAETPFVIGDLVIEPFRIPHDAADPMAFRVSSNGMSLAIVTDLGEVTPQVRVRLSGIDALVLEANHEPELLRSAPYPSYVKGRIAGSHGHLSNGVAADLLESLASSSHCKLQVVVAAHISQNANTPERAVAALQEGWDRGSKGTQQAAIVAASVHEPTELFTLRAGCANGNGVSEEIEVQATQKQRPVVSRLHSPSPPAAQR